MTKFDLEHAITRWEYNSYGDRKEPRTTIHIDKVAAELIKHLPGEWTIAHASIDDCEVNKPVSNVALVRADGLPIYIHRHRRNGEPWGNGTSIRIAATDYTLPNGERLDLRYMLGRPYGSGNPDCTADITKQSAATIAKAIVRKVITPAEPGVAAYRERLAAHHAATNARDSNKAAAEKLGIALREHWNSKERFTGRIPNGPEIEISERGTITVKSFDCDAATLAKLVKLLAK